HPHPSPPPFRGREGSHARQMEPYPYQGEGRVGVAPQGCGRLACRGVDDNPYAILASHPGHDGQTMTGRQDLYDESMQLGHSAAWDLQWDRAIEYYNKALAEIPED